MSPCHLARRRTSREEAFDFWRALPPHLHRTYLAYRRAGYEPYTDSEYCPFALATERRIPDADEATAAVVAGGVPFDLGLRNRVRDFMTLFDCGALPVARLDRLSRAHTRLPHSRERRNSP